MIFLVKTIITFPNGDTKNFMTCLVQSKSRKDAELKIEKTSGFVNNNFEHVDCLEINKDSILEISDYGFLRSQTK